MNIKIVKFPIMKKVLLINIYIDKSNCQLNDMIFLN